MKSDIVLINHSTVLIQLDGIRILTDPVFRWMISPVIPRLRKPGIPFRSLPPIDIILITHDHFDHLSMQSLRRLRRRNQSVMMMPDGVGRYGKRAGFDQVEEMKWWDRKTYGNVTVHCVPAQHKGGRFPWSRSRSLCCGYIIQSNGVCIYNAGDTGYGDHFREIGTRFSVDAALLPIGAYKPLNWFREIHLHPYKALDAFVDLRARHLIPVHWGTFKISDEPLDEPPHLLQEEAERRSLADRVHVLRNGEGFELPEKRERKQRRSAQRKKRRRVSKR